MQEKLRDAGVDVISSEEYLVHTSGHGCKEDIKRMLELVRPRVMIPVHGDKRDIRKAKTLRFGTGRKRSSGCCRPGR
ncbi:MAG: MBL fold metallo-hydrolase RNA specificity domain-containing protein [Alphaproteobacteria bacterium]